MNAVSGSYQAFQPVNLSCLELAALLATGTMWIGNAQIEAPPYLGLLAANVAHIVPTNPPISIDNLMVWNPAGVEGFAVLSSPATRIEESKAAYRLIDELEALEDNWDGYGGAAISAQACNNARLFIRAFIAESPKLPLPEISPTAAGTISFEWETQTAEVYFEIGDTHYSGFIKANGQQTTYLQGRGHAIDRQIVVLVQNAISPPVMHSFPITEISFYAQPHEHVAV